MTTLTSKKENLSVEFKQSFYIIEGNHGNHAGFNRKWTTWYEGYDDAGKAGIALANHINDLNNLIEGDEDYEVCMMSANYDLCPFEVVSAEELIERYDASGSSLYNIQSWSISIEENK